jgi:hypothetical protein
MRVAHVGGPARSVSVGGVRLARVGGPSTGGARVGADAPTRPLPSPRAELAIASPGEARVELPPLALPTPTPSPPLGPPSARADVAPPPAVAAVPQSLTLGGGGLFCVTVGAQYSFEQTISPATLGISVPRVYTLAFANPRIDHSHSWCGEASIRVDASFDQSGRRNFFGRFANETGQLLIKFDHPVDFTDKTVTVHFFVEGPSDARFSAELAVVQRGSWVSGQPLERLGPGRWWTVSQRFGAVNAAGVPGSSNPLPYPIGGTSPVNECDRLSLAVHATGELRAWTGAIYVDDVTWK